MRVPLTKGMDGPRHWGGSSVIGARRKSFELEIRKRVADEATGGFGVTPTTQPPPPPLPSPPPRPPPPTPHPPPHPPDRANGLSGWCFPRKVPPETGRDLPRRDPKRPRLRQLDPTRGHVAVQFVVLGFVSVALNTLADLMVAYAASGIRDGASARPGLIRRLREASGAAMMALGIGLALAKRPAT